MLAAHPYKNWPLHVMLFTEEAVRGWTQANKKVAIPLPPGLTCNTELEGVDGKSCHPGSGRQGPIEVTDGMFHRSQNTALSYQSIRRAVHICTSGKAHSTASLKKKTTVLHL
jgi:structure-specific endonuclease subunit SLX1